MSAGICDIDEGHCTAGLMIRGEFYRCDLARDHYGWAHENAAAMAIWTGDGYLD